MKAHVGFTDLIEKAEPKDPKEEFVRMLDMTGQGELFPVVKDGLR